MSLICFYYYLHYVIIYYRKEVYMDEHFKNNQDVVFKGVHALIYVFDVDNKGVKLNEDTMNYQMCLAAISAYSPTANVFILMHKMDLVKEDQTETVPFIFKLIF